MEEYNLQVQDFKDDHIGQWAAIRQPRLQRLLLRLGHKKPVLIPKASIGEQTDRGDESDTTQNYQNQAKRREGCLAKGITQHPVGLQNHGKDPNWRDTLQTHLQL